MILGIGIQNQGLCIVAYDKWLQSSFLFKFIITANLLLMWRSAVIIYGKQTQN